MERPTYAIRIPNPERIPPKKRRRDPLIAGLTKCFWPADSKRSPFGGFQTKDSLFIMRERIYYTEINDLLKKLISKYGYSEMKLKMNTTTECNIIVKVSKAHNFKEDPILGFNTVKKMISMRIAMTMPDVTVNLYVEKIPIPGLCAAVHAEMIKKKMEMGVKPKRLINGSIIMAMNSGADGICIIISGKMVGMRAKSIKTKRGTLVYSGHMANVYMDKAQQTAILRQGAFGIKVDIKLPWDPEGVKGPSLPMPDKVYIYP